MGEGDRKAGALATADVVEGESHGHRTCDFPLPPLPPALALLARGCGPPPPLLRNGGGKLLHVGTASKAMVVRASLERNGTVPCHMYDGNSTSVPTRGRRARRTAPVRPKGRLGSPN